MQPVTVVVFGLGAMQGLMVKLLVERGVAIVGAVDNDPDKVGKDVGRVAGLEYALGVCVEDDPDRAMAGRRVDCAVICTNSYLKFHAPHIEACLRNGANVVTLNEETIFPWWTSPACSARLDALAREHGVSLLASGNQDLFWVNLGAQLAGAATRIDEVRWATQWTPEGLALELFESMGIGRTVDEFAKLDHSFDQGRPSFALAAVDALAANLGLGMARRTTTIEPVVAAEATPCTKLDAIIPEGCVIGASETVRREAPGQPTLTFTMTGRLFKEGERPGESWEILGEPNLRMTTDYEYGHMQVVAQLLHRIPDVIRARPGLLTPDDLPPLRHRSSFVPLQSP